MQYLRANQTGIKITLDHLTGVPVQNQVDLTTMHSTTLIVYAGENIVGSYAMVIDGTSKLGYYVTTGADIFADAGNYTIEQSATDGTNVYRTLEPVALRVLK